MSSPPPEWTSSGFSPNNAFRSRPNPFTTATTLSRRPLTEAQVRRIVREELDHVEERRRMWADYDKLTAAFNRNLPTLP